MLLEALIVASEKAANIARKCREDEHLFQLLIEEKKADEANPRFVRDFKTLADVLIQETLRHDIGCKFPSICEHIRGEESNVFCNTLGESIAVKVSATSEDTARQLAKVLEGDWQAARLLADEVHREVRLADVNTTPIDRNVELSTAVGIWIDPIDSTAEYISAGEEHEIDGIAISGLKCVTVLIGVYSLTDGQPIMGIINQPFYERVHEIWQGRCYWGVNSPGFCMSSLMRTQSSPKMICLSSSEDVSIKNALRGAGFALVEAAGAGYKLLLTAIGAVDLYVLSKNSTFKWDTCGPHALLRSLQGDIVVYEHPDVVLTYSICTSKDGSSFLEGCCNRGGIIGFRDRSLMRHVVGVLKKW